MKITKTSKNIYFYKNVQKLRTNRKQKIIKKKKFYIN